MSLVASQQYGTEGLEGEAVDKAGALGIQSSAKKYIRKHITDSKKP